MQRIQFYPNQKLAHILNKEASRKGVSVSQFVTDLLENYYGLSSVSISDLTPIVLNEVEDFLKNAKGNIEFDLNIASSTYKNINMTIGKKPSTIRASIGRSFASRVGKEPFINVRKCNVNGKQKLSVNNALVYETF